MRFRTRMLRICVWGASVSVVAAVALYLTHGWVWTGRFGVTWSLPVVVWLAVLLPAFLVVVANSLYWYHN